MAQEPGNTEESIAKVITEAGPVNTKKDKILPSIGKQRPVGPEHEKFFRKLMLEHHFKLHSEKLGQPPVPIEQSDRALADDLDLHPLYLATTLITGEWKVPFMKEYLGLASENEVRRLYPTTDDQDKALEKAMKQIGQENFVDRVAIYLDSVIKESVGKDEKRHTGELTVGMELEVNEKKSYRNRAIMERLRRQTELIDQLQQLGYPIEYDALREIPLPKSTSSHDQLKAFLLLLKGNFIDSNQMVGTHLNIGGFRRLDENLFLLEYMATAARLFEEKINAFDKFDPLAEEQKAWAKPLYEDDADNDDAPRGLPFVVRLDGVIEFRWLTALKGVTNYRHAAKGFETFVQTCEAIAAWQKVNDKYPWLTEKDRELAKVWEHMRLEALAQFKTYDMTNFDLLNKVEEDARKCAETKMQVRKNVATYGVGLSKETLAQNEERKSEMYRLFVEGRSKINEILSDKTTSET